MSEFKNYHPIVNFVYFTAVIAFSIFIMHPVALIISLGCSFTYSFILKGKANVILLILLIVSSALINPAFNHEGITILTYLPSGNPLTLESMVYGVAAAFMLGSVIYWFLCSNEIMTSDKFIYLFGRIIPSLSLILSMALRFVPRFGRQMKIIAQSQKGIGRDVSDGGIIHRAKQGIKIISIMITWALENAIETADSMKSRGYGLKGRSAFSIFRFDKRDLTALIYIMVACIYLIIGKTAMYCNYYPMIKMGDVSVYSVSVFAVYFALCVMPIAIEVWEVIKWKSIKSKI